MYADLHPSIVRARELIESAEVSVRKAEAQREMLDRLYPFRRDPLEEAARTHPMPQTMVGRSIAQQKSTPMITKQVLDSRLDGFASAMGEAVGECERDLINRVTKLVEALERRVAELEEIATRP